MPCWANLLTVTGFQTIPQLFWLTNLVETGQSPKHRSCCALKWSASHLSSHYSKVVLSRTRPARAWQSFIFAADLPRRWLVQTTTELYLHIVDEKIGQRHSSLKKQSSWWSVFELCSSPRMWRQCRRNLPLLTVSPSQVAHLVWWQ